MKKITYIKEELKEEMSRQLKELRNEVGEKHTSTVITEIRGPLEATKS